MDAYFELLKKLDEQDDGHLAIDKLYGNRPMKWSRAAHHLAEVKQIVGDDNHGYTITAAGIEALRAERKYEKEVWINRIVAIAALIVSIVALFG